jgi:uncharacterized coiled-coil DUF342 family protein
MREYIDELEAHARRLERQRDELRDKTIDALTKVGVLTEAADYLNGRLREVTAQCDEWKSIAKEALMSFRCTQRPEIYPEGHWSRRAQGLLGDHAIAAVKGGQGE